MLESAQVPNQQALVAFLRKGITGLGTASIERVKIYGRQTGEEFSAWNQEFELVVQNNWSSLHIEEDTTSQISLSSLDTEESKVSEPSIQSKNSKSPNTLEGEKWANLGGLLLLASLILLFINWQFALTTFVVAMIAYNIYQGTPAGKYDTEKRKLESEKKAEEDRLKKIQQEEEKNIEKIQQEEARRLLIDNVKSEVRNLKTNLAHDCINEFIKVNARLSVGVSYMDLPSVIASAKLATQLFEKSKDYHVCLYLSELIKKNMFYYELSFQCFDKRFHNIIFNEYLEQIIINLFPELKGRKVYFDFDSIVQTIWMKAAQCSDEIDDILELSDNNN
ncbi:hypothetical protein [Nostoc sp. FACHB-892]|uniref:hypothetical protein n=1 Tax=Nostoc sp. FACHB-892 TaxID=2692843 RepID=UPI001F548635|nr:hypothetical protein [Nostoc sp. FACHB-892]